MTQWIEVDGLWHVEQRYTQDHGAAIGAGEAEPTTLCGVIFDLVGARNGPRPRFSVRPFGAKACRACVDQLDADGTTDGPEDTMRCGTLSSVTERRCLLPEGHAQWKADRFHCFVDVRAEQSLVDTSVAAITEHRRWHDEDPNQGKSATCWKCAGHVRALLGFRADDAKRA